VIPRVPMRMLKHMKSSRKDARVYCDTVPTTQYSMIPFSPPFLRRSNSESLLYVSHGSNQYPSSREKNAMSCVLMGPVTSALVLYVADRMVSRVLKGQIMRKGVARKVKRLFAMLAEMNIIHQFLCDVFEDLLASQNF
jgi:hypothetical protein